MRTVRFYNPKISYNVFLLVLIQLTINGCSFTRYTDGPITEYLKEPIPKVDKPIARTLSVEKVMYQTAMNMQATMISDLVAKEIYFLPSEVGREVKKTLKLDDKYNMKNTYAALNIIAMNRAKARHMRSKNTAPAITPTTMPSSPSTQKYIRAQEDMAKIAYGKGDYLRGDIHNSAAMNAMQIDQSFAQTQATVGLTFSVLNSLALAGEMLVKNDFIKLRNWIEYESGAIGKQAPQDRHLSVFFLQFFDAESFQLDSRNRVAVFLVLTDKTGVIKTVLEGSDILNCEGECNLFKPKSTARVFDKNTHSKDVQQQLSSSEGNNYLMNNGFDALSGFYQYVLLQHGLKKLSNLYKN